MTGTYCIKCMSDGNPSVIMVAPGTNVHLFVDMTDTGNVTFANGTISIPVENAKNYEGYHSLPQEELDEYFNELMKRVMNGLMTESLATLDICAIRASLLEQYWSRWIRQGYVHRSSTRPGVMGLYAQQKKSWF